MKEKLKFRPVAKVRLPDEEVETTYEIISSEEKCDSHTSEDILKLTEKEKIKSYTEIFIYDVLLEPAKSSTELKTLNTEVKEKPLRQMEIPQFDLAIEDNIQIEKIKSLRTNISNTSVFYEMPEIVDVNLVSYELKMYPSAINTEVPRELQMSASRSIDIVPLFDLTLESRTQLSKQLQNLNTEVVVVDMETGIESLHSAEEENQLPLLEELIECNGRFPRSFSESFNSPFVLLIGEDEIEWHIPIIYVLKELFREITDRYPRITFREPETFEEGVEERIDSLDPHSLDQFTFEYKIEFLDARKMSLAVNEFVKIVKGRLNSAFLQQFGILVVAVRRRDLERAKKALEIEGLRVYTCKPDDNKYKLFCSKVLGVSSLSDFFSNLKAYEKCLNQTVRRFSIFVKRGVDATDKFQYPLKVATFIYLLNDLRKRKKKLINNFEKLCEFVKEVIDREIKVEEGLNGGKIIPDLIYSPESGKEVYIEIETLIGTLEPLKKIDETVEKYKDHPEANIWIVLRPVSAMLHYEELKARKKAYEVLYKDKKIKVDFKVLMLLVAENKFRWELVSLDEFLKGVRDVK